MISSQRTIHIYWDQGFPSAPELVNRISDLWELAAPGWRVHRYSAADVDEHLRAYGLDIEELTVQIRSDIFRLHLLKREGGLWVDATVLPTKQSAMWLNCVADSELFMFQKPFPDRLVSTWLIYAQKKDNLLINAWLSGVLTYFTERKRRPLDEVSFPERALTHAIRRIAPHHCANPRLGYLTSGFPYFIAHYILARASRTGTNLSKLLAEMPYVPADTAHLLQRQLRSKGPSMQGLGLLLSSGPVHKLTWKEPGLYDQAIELVEQQFRNIENEE